MLKSMDRNIGKVINCLEKYNISDNTIIAFINDNGGGGNQTPKHTRNTAMNAPLRGYKMEIYEGGIRVPMIIRCPGKVKTGLVYQNMVSGMDLYPTLISAANLCVPDLYVIDGVDLLPFLSGENEGLPHDILFWRSNPWLGPRHLQKQQFHMHDYAVRQGKWKMVRRAVPFEHDNTDSWELYDLTTDIGEQHDLAPEHKDGIVKTLESAFEQWCASLPPQLVSSSSRDV